MPLFDLLPDTVSKPIKNFASSYNNSPGPAGTGGTTIPGKIIATAKPKIDELLAGKKPANSGGHGEQSHQGQHSYGDPGQVMGGGGSGSNGDYYGYVNYNPGGMFGPPSKTKPKPKKKVNQGFSLLGGFGIKK